jgi:thiamine-phosphate pyrophosphorylase
MISRLQYITQDLPGTPHVVLAEEACLAGCDWIQLRVKNKADSEWRSIAREVLAVCREHEVKLIVNDNLQLAKEIRADGVHLGKNDTSTAEARKVLGPDFIIGGTANTFHDILMHAAAGVDYIGLGPFRFTATKEKLSPILGYEGYEEILMQCRGAGINIPIIAIGGILASDVRSILETGIHGVAVSSVITQSKDKTGTVLEFMSGIIGYLNKVSDDRTIKDSR